MEIALWLVPASAADATTLGSLISTLSTAHATPAFSPHVTLLTGIPADASPATLLSTLRTALAAAPTAPFSLALTSLRTKAAEGNYFQYLFAIVDPANEPLMQLRRTVREALLPAELVQQSDDYFPHLSLMYGVDTDQRKAVNLMEDLVAKGSAGVTTMRVEEVLLVKCEGKPDEWQVLGKVSL